MFFSIYWLDELNMLLWRFSAFRMHWIKERSLWMTSSWHWNSMTSEVHSVQKSAEAFAAKLSLGNWNWNWIFGFPIYWRSSHVGYRRWEKFGPFAFTLTSLQKIVHFRVRSRDMACGVEGLINMYVHAESRKKAFPWPRDFRESRNLGNIFLPYSWIFATSGLCLNWA